MVVNHWFQKGGRKFSKKRGLNVLKIKEKEKKWQKKGKIKEILGLKKIVDW